MPLNTEVLRNDEIVKLTWDYFTLSCMYTAAIKEGAPNTPIRMHDGTDSTFGELEDGQWIDFSMEPIYYLDIPCDLVKRGSQILHKRHEFRYDGERTVVFEAGDKLRAWRSSK